MHSGTKFGYFQFILSSENCKTHTKIRFVNYSQNKEGTKTIHKHKKPSEFEEFEAWGNVEAGPLHDPNGEKKNMHN